ncbi:MAG: phosphoribosylglycinamide formyltransferase [Bacteroidales bacterium]|nr:phosphoribosylglycinamide formyltransferase [Bacteroidales bacterium]
MENSPTHRIAIFASGSGTNAENIVRYFRAQADPIAQVALILCNRPQAGVIQRAARLGIPCHCFNREDLLEGRILPLLNKESIDFVVLAGFLLRIPEYLIEAYPQAIVNIHPALLPKFGGKGMYGDHVHQSVVEAGESQTGITIHYVNAELDKGSIICQKTCPVLPGEDYHQVAEKVHLLEYEHYPKVIDSLLRQQSAGRD